MGSKVGYLFPTQPHAKTDAIKLATLHLDREAHEWWYHGLVTLGHNTIHSYGEFTQKLIERFDRKDPEIHSGSWLNSNRPVVQKISF